MRRRPRYLARRSRAGFTIVEVIVAILILTVGVLGLAGASAIVTRMMADAEVQSDAAVVAAARFETLHGSRCPLSNGSATSATVSERWHATQRGRAIDRVYDVTDSVRFSSRGGSRTQAYESVVRCLP